MRLRSTSPIQDPEREAISPATCNASQRSAAIAVQDVALPRHRAPMLDASDAITRRSSRTSPRLQQLAPDQRSRRCPSFVGDIGAVRWATDGEASPDARTPCKTSESTQLADRCQRHQGNRLRRSMPARRHTGRAEMEADITDEITSIKRQSSSGELPSKTRMPWECRAINPEKEVCNLLKVTLKDGTVSDMLAVLPPMKMLGRHHSSAGGPPPGSKRTRQDASPTPQSRAASFCRSLSPTERASARAT